jgi:hypothetical protein
MRETRIDLCPDCLGAAAAGVRCSYCIVGWQYIERVVIEPPELPWWCRKFDHKWIKSLDTSKRLTGMCRRCHATFHWDVREPKQN